MKREQGTGRKQRFKTTKVREEKVSGVKDNSGKPW